MKVLLITDRIPYPLTNGQNLRIFHFIKNLKVKHDFDMISYGMKPYPQEIIPLFDDIYSIDKKPKNDQKHAGISRFIRSISPKEMFVYDPKMQDLVASVISGNKFDLIWVSGWNMLVYAPYISDVPLLADVVDDGLVEHYRAIKKADTIYHFFISLKNFLHNYLFERKYFRMGTVCNVVSELDARVIRRICPRLPITVVHNGVDTHYYKPLNGKQDKFKIIFQGNMHFAPNVDGVRHFCKKILPIIAQRIPQIKFYIVGKDPTPAVETLACDNVIVTGYVEDVRPHVDESAVFVCPLRKGAGIKNKILQAWAMAKAIVATPESCGGLQTVPGENIMIVSSPCDFASAVINLIEDVDKRRKMGIKGMKTVQNYYRWENKSNELNKVFSLTTERFMMRGK